MAKLFRARVEIEIPLLAEDEHDAYNQALSFIKEEIENINSHELDVEENNNIPSGWENHTLIYVTNNIEEEFGYDIDFETALKIESGEIKERKLPTDINLLVGKTLVKPDRFITFKLISVNGDKATILETNKKTGEQKTKEATVAQVLKSGYECEWRTE